MNFFKIAILFVFLHIIFLLDLKAQENTVKCGIDVLIENDFMPLNGRRVILLTNHAGRTNTGKSTVQAFLDAENCRLTALMTPEHGFFTTVPAGNKVDDEELFEIPVFSLYGDSKTPPAEKLRLCDIVVIDMQDIGVRSYTYISTIYKVMKECAKAGKPVMILDRPNPLGGISVDGNVLENGMNSFVGIVPVTYIHGLTVGELAVMINEEGWLSDLGTETVKCRLSVIEMQGWERWMNWEDTNLQWFPTSPHVPTIASVRGIAALGILGELGIISIGIGTTLPFQYFGSPYFSTADFEKYFNIHNVSGIKFIEARYRPFYGMYSGRDCSGYLLKFRPNNLFAPYSTAIRILYALRQMDPGLFSNTNITSKQKNMFQKVTGSKEILSTLIEGKSYSEIMVLAQKGLEEFLQFRQKYLLYE